MIKYFDSTVFNTGADAIVNTVNCDGFMGSGLALEFSLRYPDMYFDYIQKCKNNIIKVGSIDAYYAENVLIVNFPTKNSFKFPSKIQWIEAGLQDFVKKYKDLNIKSIAFPKLGCSNGGLKWNDVKSLLEKYLSNIDLVVYICLDNYPKAIGKEQEMLELFNNVNLYEIADVVNLNKKQINALNQNGPYCRFWQISKINNIGKTTYKKLFQYFYNNQSVQQKLFKL